MLWLSSFVPVSDRTYDIDASGSTAGVCIVSMALHAIAELVADTSKPEDHVMIFSRPDVLPRYLA